MADVSVRPRTPRLATKPDALADGALLGSVAVGTLFGLVGVFFLATGRVGAFFGFAVVGAGLAGLARTGRRLVAPPEEDPGAASAVGA